MSSHSQKRVRSSSSHKRSPSPSQQRKSNKTQKDSSREKARKPASDNDKSEKRRNPKPSAPRKSSSSGTAASGVVKDSPSRKSSSSNVRRRSQSPRTGTSKMRSPSPSTGTRTRSDVKAGGSRSRSLPSRRRKATGGRSSHGSRSSRKSAHSHSTKKSGGSLVPPLPVRAKTPSPSHSRHSEADKQPKKQQKSTKNTAEIVLSTDANETSGNKSMSSPRTFNKTQWERSIFKRASDDHPKSDKTQITAEIYPQPQPKADQDKPKEPVVVEKPAEEKKAEVGPDKQGQEQAEPEKMGVNVQGEAAQQKAVPGQYLTHNQKKLWILRVCQLCVVFVIALVWCILVVDEVDKNVHWILAIISVHVFVCVTVTALVHVCFVLIKKKHLDVNEQSVAINRIWRRNTIVIDVAQFVLLMAVTFHSIILAATLSDFIGTDGIILCVLVAFITCAVAVSHLVTAKLAFTHHKTI